MMKETVKRLKIEPKTLRELYLKSGNCCAFPGCRSRIMNTEGVFIGQICHIEAAEEGGERFNENQSNEERRHVSNLILMCYPHHRVTNDVTVYTPAFLKEMKSKHEAKFTDLVAVMEKAIEDQAAKTEIKPAQSLASINSILGWNLSIAELLVVAEDAAWAANRIRCLPIPTRQLLTVIVKRMKRIALPQNQYRYERDVLHHEVAQACGLSISEVGTHVQIMDKYGIATSYDKEHGKPACITLRSCPHGWQIWGDFNEFSKKASIPVEAFTEELRFDLFD